MSKDVEILIVEENLAESEHLRHILEQHEYRVTVEHNGKAALDAALANPPQIVISGKLQAETNERNRVEQSLIESEKHFRLIVESAQEGVWMLDEQANTSYVNDRMTEILGYAADEMLGHSMYDFMDDESRIEAERYFQKRQKGIKEKHDFRFRRKDGTDLWAIVSTNPIMNDNNVFMGAVGLVTDITDRRQVEDSLRTSERRFRELVEILPIAVYTCDLSGGIESYNKCAVELWGRTPDCLSIVDRFCGSYKIYNTDGVYLPHNECPMAQINTVLTGTDLGGRTLTPGVYCFTSTAQLTGILTLDAQNDPNAVFIFQIGSTLTTASNSSVLVINGGSSCNVFFQVGSSATLGTNTSFMGNILALTSITLTTGASITSGRALALNGAVTLDTNNVSSLGCTNAPTAAMVNIGGRVTNAFGRGISRALIKMTDGAGVVRTTYTNSFGYYKFADVEVGQTLIFDVKAKRYNFNKPTQVVSLTEEATKVNFIAY